MSLMFAFILDGGTILLPSSILFFMMNTEKITIEKIRENIYLIKEVFYAEHANLYLFTGAGNNAILFDTGVGILDINEFLKSKGFIVIAVVLTHAHYDHIGGLKYFPKNFLIPQRVHENLSHPDLFAMKYFNSADVEENVRSEMDEYSVHVPAVDSYMSNRTFSFGKFEFEMISAPGHSNDSMMFYEKNTKTLISGDALYDGAPYFDLPNSNVTDMRNSLRLIQKIDFELLLPGHNQVLKKSESNSVIDRWLSVIPG